MHIYWIFLFYIIIINEFTITGMFFFKKIKSKNLKQNLQKNLRKDSYIFYNSQLFVYIKYN